MPIAADQERRAMALSRINRARRGKKPPNYGKTYPPEPLNAREIEALLTSLKDGPAGVRNRALVVLLWRSALRIAEALALYPKDVDLLACTAAVLHGKGDKARLVGFDARAAEILHEWLTVRAALGIADTAPLFCTVVAGQRGRTIRAAYVRDALKRMARNAGVHKRVHPHGLRHTCATELHYEDVPLPLIQAQLGHSSPITTAGYLHRIAPKLHIDAMRARSWPERMAVNGHPADS